jgi:hypothetical protein
MTLKKVQLTGPECSPNLIDSSPVSGVKHCETNMERKFALRKAVHTWTKRRFKLLEKLARPYKTISRKSRHRNCMVGSWFRQAYHCDVTITDCFDLKCNVDRQINEVFIGLAQTNCIPSNSYLEYLTTLGDLVKSVV